MFIAKLIGVSLLVWVWARSVLGLGQVVGTRCPIQTTTLGS